MNKVSVVMGHNLHKNCAKCSIPNTYPTFCPQRLNCHFEHLLIAHAYVRLDVLQYVCPVKAHASQYKDP